MTLFTLFSLPSLSSRSTTSLAMSLLAFFALNTLTTTIAMSNAHAEPLKPMEVSYTLSMRSKTFGNSTLGKIESKLTTTDKGYSVVSVTKVQGMAAIIMGSNEQQSCHFHLENGRAVSENYTGGKIGSVDYQVGFDWEQRKLNFDDNELLDMPQGYIVDNCMMPFAVAILKGKTLSEDAMYVVDGKKKRIRGYKLRSSEPEVLKTKLGEKKTIKMVLEREFKPERTFTLWLSEDDQYIPLKIEEKRKSRTTTMAVNSLELI